MALKPAVILVSAGTLALLAGVGISAFNWQLLYGPVLWPDPGLWLAVAGGALLSCIGVVLLMLGVQRIVDDRDARRMADRPVGPLAGRRNLRSSQWPSEQ
jgi:hypothetical protein